LEVIASGTAAFQFDKVAGVYVPQGFVTYSLSYDSVNDEYVLTDNVGATFRFYGFGVTLFSNQQGQLKEYKDAGGNLVSLTYDPATGNLGEVQIVTGSGSSQTTESFVYSYLASGPNIGLLDNVLLRRKTGTGSWSSSDNIRQVAYNYYGEGESHGNVRDLKTATISQMNGATATAIDTTYYRYYKDDDIYDAESNRIGCTHGLKYVFGADSYARLVAAQGTDLDNISDDDARWYADNYFQYDDQQRATKEVAQGAGCSTCSAGLGSFFYAYTSNPAGGNPADPNSWNTKTVETLPDGNENIVYTNYMGQVMLQAFHDTTTNQQWVSCLHYDGAGRVDLAAQPSAIPEIHPELGGQYYDDQYADLMHATSGNFEFLDDSNGLITTYTYGTSTTATATASGSVLGCLRFVNVQQGETGTAVPQTYTEYIARTVGDKTIYFVAFTGAFAGYSGGGLNVWDSYAYTFATGTFQVQSVFNANQSNVGVGTITWFDNYGRPIWTKDADGFVNYIAYDQATGAVAKTIVDVKLDSAHAGDYAEAAVPSGWSTPGDHLHLKTTYELDALGRPTLTTDPKGNLTYTVYQDVSHAVRVYPGFTATSGTTGTTTGPILVIREDRATAHDSYIELLAMSATPTVLGSRPTGDEAIGSLQSLRRTYFNDAGQTVEADDYFNVSSLTYTAAAHIGTLNTTGDSSGNYYETDIGYDTRGRQNRIKHGDGTIERTVYDGLGRPVSQWLGSDDTPTSGIWSPTNTAGTNLVRQALYGYDETTDGYGVTTSGIGDSHLTSVTDAMGRKTSIDYDFRGRVVTTTLADNDGDPMTWNYQSTYTTYDNLDRVLSQQDSSGTTSYVYDDGTPSVTITQPYNFSTVSTVKTYNQRGLLASLTDPDGNTTTWDYDGAGRVSSETNQLGKSRTYAYDAAGNLTDRIDRDGRKIHYDYDNANRNTAEKWYATDLTTLVRTIGFSYDAAGRLSEATDPSGTYNYSYDALGRLTNQEQAIDGLTPHIQYASLYNGASQPTQLQATVGTSSDFKNSYSYDSLARLSAVIQQSVTGGNAVAAKRADFAYNDANQVTRIGRYARTTTAELAVNTFFGYEAGGRLASLIHTMDAAAPSSGWGSAVLAGYQYTYDDVGNITSIDSYQDGTQYYGYDATKQLTGDNTSSYSYDANGNRTDGTIGDNNQLLSDANYNYTYDDEGNRLTRTDIYTGEKDTYEWDHRNRLITVQHWSPDVEPAENWGVTSDGTSSPYFLYGSVSAVTEGGDIVLSISGGGGLTLEYWTVDVSATRGSDYTSSATASSPALLPYTGVDPIYVHIPTLTDSNNETTESLAIHLRIQGYPSSEMVLEADIQDANGPSLLQAVNYAYDAFNQLVSRSFDADGAGSGTATTTFYSYQGGQVALQFDGSAAADLSHRNLWNPAAVDQLFADERVSSLSSAGDVLWTLADHLGTIRDLAAHNASTRATTIENHRVYDSFGNLTSETNAAIDEIFGFTGRQLDEATGLQNNLNRWYDAKTGRWTSEDPIGFAGEDSNLQRYAGNTPINATDPQGLWQQKFEQFNLAAR